MTELEYAKYERDTAIARALKAEQSERQMQETIKTLFSKHGKTYSPTVVDELMKEIDHFRSANLDAMEIMSLIKGDSPKNAVVSSEFISLRNQHFKKHRK